MNKEKYLIFGLGNTGKQYEASSHNVGFMAVDRLAALWKIEMHRHRKNAQPR